MRIDAQWASDDDNLDSYEELPDNMADADVIVIGGGLAGMAAALACQSSGQSTILLESRIHLGGRVSSVQLQELNIHVDNCQHACFRVYDRFLEFMNEVGLNESIKIQDKTKLRFLDTKNGQSAILTTGRLSPPHHMVKSMLAFPFLSMKDKLAMRKVIKILSKMTEEEMWKLDEMSFESWLRSHGQTDMSIQRFWSFFVLAALNISIEEASAAQACMLFKRGLFGQKNAFEVGAFTHDLGTVFNEHARPLLESKGLQIQCSTTVKHVVEENDFFEIHTSTSTLTTTNVILATPHHITKKLLDSSSLHERRSPQSISQKIEGLEYRSLIGIHAFYRGNRVPIDFDFASLIDEPIIQMIFNRNSELKTSPEGFQWLSVPISAADEFLNHSDDELKTEFERVVNTLWPLSKDVELASFFVVRNIKGTFAPTPGSYALRPRSDELGERMALAGCYTSTGWPSTMEGAVRSGLMAAAHILNRMYHHDEPWETWNQPTAWPTWRWPHE